MTDISAAARREHLGAVARSTAISALLGMVVVFLTTISRREFWGWRLVVYGLSAGFLVYVFCYVFDNSLSATASARGGSFRTRSSAYRSISRAAAPEFSPRRPS